MVKKSRIFLYGIFGGVTLTLILWFVSWKWEAHTHFLIGNRLTYFALGSGVVGFGSYTIKRTPSTPIFVFRGGESDDTIKEYFLFGGIWYADMVPQGGYFSVPIWFATMLISMLGIGIALELHNSRRVVDFIGSNNIRSTVPDELPSAEKKTGGSRDNR